MGARKTGTVLAWLQAERASTLVVAPSCVHGHWAREAARFYPDATVLKVSGTSTKKKRLDLLEQFLLDDNLNPQAFIYITTYESMKADQHELHKAPFDAVVFDEGHRLKGRRTQVALCANDIIKRRKHVILATGTPVVNHASELWQYLHMLAPSVYPAFWKWADKHFFISIEQFPGNRFPTRVIKGYRPGQEEVVRNQIEPFFIQRPIEELFPGAAWVVEPEHIEIEVELSPAERRAYDTLVKHKWTKVGATEVTTQNALDLSTRLQQFTSEWGTIDADVEEGTKVKAAADLVLDLLEREEKVVVFAKYKATVHRLIVALNKTNRAYAVTFTGDKTAQERENAAGQFIIGRANVLVGTLDSLSEGVDGLQHASHTAVMVDRHWTPAKNDQAIGRLRRSGQLSPVQVYHVFAKDTIDATITAACLCKTNVIESLRGRPLVDALYGRV